MFLEVIIDIYIFFIIFFCLAGKRGGGGGWGDDISINTCKSDTIHFSAIKCRHMPSHASREILVLFGSLTSCDPGDIHETIQVMYLSYWLLHAG